jgi:hypothetical protein
VSSITRDFATRRSGAPERNAGVLLLHPASRSPAAAGPTTATTATERLVERCVATGCSAVVARRLLRTRRCWPLASALALSY